MQFFVWGGIALGWLGWLCFNSQAAPHFSVIAGERDTGSYQFAEEFSRLWGISAFNTKSSLIPVSEKTPDNRLKRLRLRQGDLAILDPKNAYQLLPQNPELAVISVLWPNVLYVISRQSELVELQISTPNTIHIHENSDYFVTTWSKLLSFQNYNPDQFQWFAAGQSQQVLSNLSEGVFLMTAPYPLQEIKQLLITDTSYKFIPLNEMLLVGNHQHYPWIITNLLPTNLYPSVLQPLPMLTSYPVLIARVDTNPSFIQNVLKILFSQRDRLQPHALFQFLDPQNNQRFKNYQFHPTSKKLFKL